MGILRWLTCWLFKLKGWRVIGDMPPGVKKAVLIFVPHTSNWDAFYGLAAIFSRNLSIRFVIKKEVMFFPLNFFLYRLGAIPIDRKSKNIQPQSASVVNVMVDMFAAHSSLIIAIAPEGTRSYVKRWKRGFYQIALQARVPIVLGYLDYANKQAGYGPAFYPTGNVDEDIQKIQAFYKDKMGKYPAQGVR